MVWRGGSWIRPSTPPQLLLRCLLLVVSSTSPAFLCSGAGDVAVRFSKVPPPLSASPSAVFAFEATPVLQGSNGGGVCMDCSITCKLDNDSSSDCGRSGGGVMRYRELSDGKHRVAVCASRGGPPASCANYTWALDTVPPTASVTAECSFTSASNVSVLISFSEPCPGGGGFRCNQSYCNLIVYGPGHVVPSSLEVVEPGLEYSLVVNISTDVQYGRLFLVMDRRFCTDAAGNRFTRTSNSSFTLHFDRRDVYMNITTRIPEKLLHLNGVTRVVEATNDEKDLKIYLSFSEPVLNSSAEILGMLNTTGAILSPTNRSTLGNRRFGYIVNKTSSTAIVTVTCETSSIISRQGTPVYSSEPFTFLYDTQRPKVKLATSNARTSARNIPVLIKFEKPVFNFNSSAVLVSGGNLLSFHEASRSIYTLQIQAVDKLISIEVAENSTQDVAGNMNLASDRLEVRHYSVPASSSSVSIITRVIFLATAVVATLLTVSTSALLASGAFSRPPSYMISEPSRNLLRIACHIQVFALSRWLAVNLPIEYYEFTKGIEWIIPNLHLPWEAATADPFVGYSTLPAIAYSELLDKSTLGTAISSPEAGTKIPSEGKPLTAMEYRSFLKNQNMKPEAQIIMKLQDLDGWKYFGRNMFWLGVIGAGLVLLHAAILLSFKLRNRGAEKRRDYGALAFPRFEVMLIILALPCMSQASAALIRGGTTAGLVAGIALMGILTSFLVSLLLFLSLGITMGKLLQYKEVHQEGLEYHWYQEIIRRTLGPGKRGQWTWKDQENTACLTKLGPLFEDLRGPPKYLLSQIAGGGRTQGKREERIIASEDENEDAEAPFIQKLFGILRIYTTFLESVKRVALGIVAGAHASSNRSSKIHTIVILSIASFQLFFVMLKKPFIKKRVQLVEIIAVASQVCVFSACLVLVDEGIISDAEESKIGISMLAVFVFAFAAQMLNEWYALYQQVRLLSPDKNSFLKGLKAASTGLLLLVLPARILLKGDDLNRQSDIAGDGVGDPGLVTSPGGQAQRSWLRQLRELAKASFSKDSSSVAAPTDPSSSTYQTTRGGKRSRSSSVTSSSDSKAKGDLRAKSKGLYKDLEAIFSSK